MVSIYDELGLTAAPFTIDDVLIYHDRPRLFWLKTAYDGDILVSNAEDTPEAYTELLVYTTPTERQRINRGRIPLRDAYTTARPGCVYLARHPTDNNSPVEIYQIDPKLIPDEWLAEPNFSL